MPPACSRRPSPPVGVIPEVNRPLSLLEDQSTGNEIFGRCAWIIGGIQRALGHCDVFGRVDETRELRIRHCKSIHPETIYGHLVDWFLLGIEILRTHAKCPARDPKHVGIGRATYGLGLVWRDRHFRCFSHLETPELRVTRGVSSLYPTAAAREASN